jgi:hypothetical protein
MLDFEKCCDGKKCECTAKEDMGSIMYISMTLSRPRRSNPASHGSYLRTIDIAVVWFVFTVSLG